MAAPAHRASDDATATVNTRTRIRAAALEAFSERGYRGTSLRDIARSVGIEVGSLYNHINSKEELLFELVEVASLELIQELDEALSSAPTDPRERLLRLVEQTVVYHGQNSSQSFVGFSEMRALTDEHLARAIELRGRMESIFKVVISECVRAGYLPPETPVSVTANMLIGMSTQVATWFHEGGTLSVEQVAAIASGIVRPWLYSGCTTDTPAAS